jgi:5-methylcytosine-specific restriction endonuclease McrA
MTRLPADTVGSRMADIFAPSAWRSCLGCGRLVAGANRCEDCARIARQLYDAGRPDHHALYRTPVWKKLSAEVRSGATRCHWCLKPTRKLAADHIIPVEQRPDLALERSNLVPSCVPCNTRRGRNAKLPDLAA